MRVESTKLSLSCTAFLFLCMLACVVGASVASAKTIYVPDDYAKIQHAVDNAGDGDTIIVRDGVYYESNIYVSKPLTLRSENGSENCIIQAYSYEYVFHVTADRVNISGFVIKDGYYGILLDEVESCYIANNNVSNNYVGIWLAVSSNNNITGNSVSGNEYGIYLDYSSDNIIYLNNFINNTDNAESIGSRNVWNSPSQVTYTYKGKTYTSYMGNYWSDYTGSDTNGDGIWDTPYSINSDNDNYLQIIHKPEHTTLDGSCINCTSFVDANGKTYTDWIPAIRIENDYMKNTSL